MHPPSLTQIITPQPADKRKPRGPSVLWIVAGSLAGVAAVVSLVLGLDELRAWRAKERASASIRERKVAAANKVLAELNSGRKKAMANNCSRDVINSWEASITFWQAQVAVYKSGTDTATKQQARADAFVAALSPKARALYSQDNSTPEQRDANIASLEELESVLTRNMFRF